MDVENVNFRGWDQLVPDILALAFCKLSLKEKLLVIPVVCKAWRVVMGSSSCWKEIEIDRWREQRVLQRLLQMLIRRSGRSLHKLSVSGLPDQIFPLIAKRGLALETLELPSGKMTDSTIEQQCGKFSLLRSLDLSYCSRIGAPALLAIGRHCKLLESFYRSAGLENFGREQGSEDDEAYAIAGAMPKLKHLRVSGRLLSTRGVLEILNRCAELRSINIRRCRGVELDMHFLSERFPQLKVEGFPAAPYSSVEEMMADGLHAYIMSGRFSDDSDDSDLEEIIDDDETSILIVT